MHCNKPQSQVWSLKSWVPSLSPKYESKVPNPNFRTEAVTIITWCPKSKFYIWIIVFVKHELIVHVIQGLPLSTASLVTSYSPPSRMTWSWSRHVCTSQCWEAWDHPPIPAAHTWLQWSWPTPQTPHPPWPLLCQIRGQGWRRRSCNKQCYKHNLTAFNTYFNFLFSHKLFLELNIYLLRNTPFLFLRLL